MRKGINQLKGNISSGVALPKLRNEKSVKDDDTESSESDSSSDVESTSVSEESSDPEIREISKTLERRVSIFKKKGEDANGNDKPVSDNVESCKQREKIAALKKTSKMSSRALKTLDPLNSELAMNLTTVQKSMSDLEKQYRSFNEEAKRITHDSKNASFSVREKHQGYIS